MTRKRAPEPAPPTALESFLTSIEARTADPVHRRLLKAVRKPDAGGALERELSKIMQELIDEA